MSSQKKFSRFLVPCKFNAETVTIFSSSLSLAGYLIWFQLCWLNFVGHLIWRCLGWLSLVCHLIEFRLGWLSLVDHLTPIQLCLLMWVSYFIQFRLFWLSLACYSIWCQLVLADNLFYSYYWFLLAALHSFSQQPLLHTSRGTPCPPSWLKPSLFQMKHQHTTLRFAQTRFPI